MGLIGHPIGFFLTCMFVGCILVVGLFSLFMRAENVERNFLVGGATIATSVIAICLLDAINRASGDQSGWKLGLICVLAVSGFVVGRIVDMKLGPKVHSRDEREATLGADLAD